MVTVDPNPIPEPNRAHLRAGGNRENVMRKKWYSATTKGLLRCPGCSKSFHLKCLTRIHHWAHSKPFTSAASVANALLHGSASLRTGDVTEEQEKLCECFNCGVEFVHRHALNRHLHQGGLVKLLTHVYVKIGSVDCLPQHWRRCCALKSAFSRSLCSAQRPLSTEFGRSRVSTFWRARFYILKVQQGLSLVLIFGHSKNLPSAMSVVKAATTRALWTHTWEKTFTCKTYGKRCSHTT